MPGKACDNYTGLRIVLGTVGKKIFWLSLSHNYHQNLKKKKKGAGVVVLTANQLSDERPVGLMLNECESHALMTPMEN